MTPPTETRSAEGWTDLPDLAAERVGGEALLASDEFFAPKENLLKLSKPVYIEDRYTDRGKWMDGWESRRKRVSGHDWCLVRLGIPGIVRGVVVDTAFFKGNYPEHCSLEAVEIDGYPAPEEILAQAEGRWTELLPRSALAGDSPNRFAIAAPARRVTHLRLNIFPDGGVARLRVHGEAVPDWRRLLRGGGWIDLAAVENGGAVVACNDMFFGSRHNMIMPGRAANMGDGWETRRKRKLPGSDWAIVRLAAPGSVRRIEVDTNHFKGNFPESCSIEGALAAPGEDDAAIAAPGRAWTAILPRTKLRAHTRHFFDDEVAPEGAGPFSHVRIHIFPDGGVSRLRLYGAPSADGLERALLARLNSLGRDAAEAELRRACGSSRWAAAMAARRPFAGATAIVAAADEVFRDLAAADWREAFAAHPRIGSRSDVAAKTGVERAFAEGEQSGARAAGADVAAALAEANRAYEDRFGHIYIVCATGKSADEMLELCRARLANAREAELAVAAAEQAKITRLRLEKMLRP